MTAQSAAMRPALTAFIVTFASREPSADISDDGFDDCRRLLRAVDLGTDPNRSDELNLVEAPTRLFGIDVAPLMVVAGSFGAPIENLHVSPFDHTRRPTGMRSRS